MTRGDISAVAAVEKNAFTSPWTEAMFAEELNNPLAVYLVLELSGEVCGYAGFWRVLDEAQVTNIAVLSSLRGAGRGKNLVSALLETAARTGAREIFLEVRRSNHAAQKFYAGLGFSVCGQRPGYYQDDGEDALLMSKLLTVDDEDE